MSTELFFILLITGLVLIGAEIFVPGGILGSIGAVALFGAVIAGFVAFPGFGAWIALGIVLLSGLAMYLWIRFFPQTGLGKRMTVARDLHDSKATNPDMEELVGKDGVATSDLRPGGFADIAGARVDVITRGEMLAKGTRLRVIDVESNRVVVKELEQT
jgi:membrane-bound serine protease (ClpP class)